MTVNIKRKSGTACRIAVDMCSWMPVYDLNVRHGIHGNGLCHNEAAARVDNVSVYPRSSIKAKRAPHASIERSVVSRTSFSSLYTQLYLLPSYTWLANSYFPSTILYCF